MFDSLEANVITSLFPEISYSIPYYGLVDFTSAVAAGSVFVGLTIVFWVIKMVLLQRVTAVAQKTNGDFDDMLVEAIQGVPFWALLFYALFASSKFFTFPETVTLVFNGVFFFVLVWQIIGVAGHFVTYFTAKFLEKDEDGDGKVDPNAATASHMVTLIAKIIMWSLGALFILSNLGIEVTSLLAGLGIGGLAIAFALQGVLSDLFASFSLYFDKPFRIGDFIVIGTDMGTVEKIGIKSTRIRTLSGEELVVSNTELTSARVQNFQKMSERRTVAQFGITYDTPQEKVREIPQMVERIFDGLPSARLDRVHFASFGDSALIFELVYYVETSDYKEFMDVQQKYNFDLMERFAEQGIEFAYPTQTIYTKQIT